MTTTNKGTTPQTANTDAQNLEVNNTESTPKKTKKKSIAKKSTKKTTRKPKLPELFIDGGSARTKYYLDKVSGAYQSVAREFPKNHDLPTGYLGVFTLGSKGYAEGDSALCLVGGTLHVGYANDN